MMTPELELRLHRLLAHLWAKLREGRDTNQVSRSALRDTVEFFQADAACLAELDPGAGRVHVVFALPEDAEWDLDLLTGFLHGDRPEIPQEVSLAPLYRRGRVWRVLALRSAAPMSAANRSALSGIARTISELAQGIDRERIVEVRSKIERKIMEQLRPKDLFYQILHGLRTLTGYDHSSALLISGEKGEVLELVAEQIAWRKGKSAKIGLRLPIEPELRQLMVSGESYGFERHDGEWRDWAGRGAIALAALLDYNSGSADSDLRESTMICAPLLTRDGVVGLLKVASCHAGSLGPYEADLVNRFMPQVSVAIQNSRRTEALQAKMLQAEKKNAMANLARTVSHDVNNALGAVLPLVQQLREDCETERLDATVLSEDLEQIERSLQVCQRIFGGMLAYARNAARGPGRGKILPAIESARAILADGMKRRKILCEIDVPAELPAVRASQSELEQVFFNVMSNARDAMAKGGRLTVRAERRDGRVDVVVEDTGCGIAEEHLARIQEPFFTTKPRGNGLGLAICRSILWGSRGEFEIKSREGQGTRVRLTLPLHEAATAAERD